MGFLQTIEFYFNAFCGIMAVLMTVISILFAARAIKQRDGVIVAMFITTSILSIMVGVCSLVTILSI